MSQPADAAKNAAGETAETTKTEAAGVASAASSAAGHVAGTAKEQAAAATDDALGEARQLFDQTRGQVEEQAGVIAHKLGEGLRELAGELRDLGEGRTDGSGQAAGLARQAATRGEHVADLLTRRGPSGVIAELRGFAGRSPGTFLLGALAAGVVAGRLTRGVRDTPDTGPETDGPPDARADVGSSSTLRRVTPQDDANRPTGTVDPTAVPAAPSPSALGGTARPGGSSR